MTADPDALLALAAEVEAATGPRYELELRVAEALGLLPRVPSCTASVDAALALLRDVLPGTAADMTDYATAGALCELRLPRGPRGEDWPKGDAPTLPLAICAAVLRAVAGEG